MNLGVIIPAYNHLPEVLQALNSLQALQGGRVCYVVQDDCSPDVNFPAVIPPRVATTWRSEVNRGFAGNCNLAAQNALTLYPEIDAFLFLNQDVYGVPDWSKGWDGALAAAFERDPNVGIVGARLLFPDGSVQNAGGTFDTAAQPVHRCLGWSNPNVGVAGQMGEVEWTTGAALAVRKDVFAQLHGFDERYRMYFEDVSICIRAREAGFKVVYQPACTLIHAVGSTGGSPQFPVSARRFKQQFVDTGRVKAGDLRQTVKYW